MRFGPWMSSPWQRCADIGQGGRDRCSMQHARTDAASRATNVSTFAAGCILAAAAIFCQIFCRGHACRVTPAMLMWLPGPGPGSVPNSRVRYVRSAVPTVDKPFGGSYASSVGSVGGQIVGCEACNNESAAMANTSWPCHGCRLETARPVPVPVIRDPVVVVEVCEKRELDGGCHVTVTWRTNGG